MPFGTPVIAHFFRVLAARRVPLPVALVALTFPAGLAGLAFDAALAGFAGFMLPPLFGFAAALAGVPVPLPALLAALADLPAPEERLPVADFAGADLAALPAVDGFAARAGFAAFAGGATLPDFARLDDLVRAAVSSLLPAAGVAVADLPARDDLPLERFAGRSLLPLVSLSTGAAACFSCLLRDAGGDFVSEAGAASGRWPFDEVEADAVPAGDVDAGRLADRGGVAGRAGRGEGWLAAAASASARSLSASSWVIWPRRTMYCTSSRALSTAKPASPAAAPMTSRMAPAMRLPASIPIS